MQGSNGELLIGSGLPATTTSLTIDQAGAVTTDLRRFEDIAFDHYGYFSQDIPLTSTTTTSTTPTVASTTAYTVTLPPVSAGNLFVSDLSSGLSEIVTLTSIAETNAEGESIPAGVAVTATVPVDGTTIVGLQLQNPSLPYNATTNPLVVFYQLESVSPLLGGRIIQITPQGVVSDFAQNFDVYTPTGVNVVAGTPDPTSFIDSELSITFSADGTTLWASDDQGIWQFKTTASLADSTTGTLIGLNDLRTLGVPYDGEGSAGGRGRHRRGRTVAAVPRPRRDRHEHLDRGSGQPRSGRKCGRGYDRDHPGQHLRRPRHAGGRRRGPVRAPGDH